MYNFFPSAPHDVSRGSHEYDLRALPSLETHLAIDAMPPRPPRGDDDAEYGSPPPPPSPGARTARGSPSPGSNEQSPLGLFPEAGSALRRSPRAAGRAGGHFARGPAGEGHSAEDAQARLASLPSDPHAKLVQLRAAAADAAAEVKRMKEEEKLKKQRERAADLAAKNRRKAKLKSDQDAARIAKRVAAEVIHHVSACIKLLKLAECRLSDCGVVDRSRSL